LDGFGDVTELLTDELVGNVVRHVGSPMTLRLVRHPDFIRVEVDDPSTNPPRLLHPDEETTRGRGIMLVNELASEWGIEIRPSGKTVWFEIDIRPTTDEARGDDRAL
jgi:anti-sigma regulatory factor (Ser/Thr protein kinase)